MKRMMGLLKARGEVSSRSPIASHGAEAETLPEQGLWTADLHGLALGYLRGASAPDRLQARFGACPAKVGELLALDRMWIGRLTADEFLLVGDEAAEMTETLAELADASDDRLLTAIDITHGRAALGLGGPGAKGGLSKLTGLDVGDRNLPDRSLAQTELARVRATLIRRDLAASPGYVVLVGRSLGEYLWDVIAEVLGPEGLEVLDGGRLWERWFGA